MPTPVKVIYDTPTLENAIIRVEMQFVLDGIVIERASLRGNGRFSITTPNFIHIYEWSHVTGTQLVESSLR